MFAIKTKNFFLNSKFSQCYTSIISDHYAICLVDPPEAPMEDRVVHNIRLSFTAQDDYRFQVNIAWDPPVYPYKNVTLYYVWNWKGDNEFISFHNTVSVDKLITANVADLILPTQKHQTHSSHDLNSAKISSKRTCLWVLW